MNRGVSIHFYMCDFTAKQSTVGNFDLDPFKLKATVHAILNLLLLIFHSAVSCPFVFRLLFQCS